MWGYSGAKKAVTLWPPEPTFLTPTSYFLPLLQKTKTNLIMRLRSSKGQNRALISMWFFDSHLSTWPVISPTGSAWHLQQRGDGMRVVHLAPPALISSALHLSPHSSLCAQLNKQARGRFPLWKPWKRARTFSPISGISIWRRHSLSLSLPPLSNLCVCSGEPMLQRWLSLSTGYNEIGPPGWLYSNRQAISIT